MPFQTHPRDPLLLLPSLLILPLPLRPPSRIIVFPLGAQAVGVEHPARLLQSVQRLIEAGGDEVAFGLGW